MDVFSAQRAALRFKIKKKKTRNWHGDLIIANVPGKEIYARETEATRLKITFLAHFPPTKKKWLKYVKQIDLLYARQN